MELQKFDYAKTESDISKRVVLVTRKPNSNVKGIQVDNLTDNQVKALISDLDALEKENMQKFYNVLKNHGVEDQIRQFIPSKMSNLIKSKV